MAKPYMCGDDLPVYIPGGGCDCNYTMEQVDTVDYAASYALKLNGEQVGVTVNIPKDMAVIAGTIGTVIANDSPYEGAIVGDKYLRLILANADYSVYVPMKDLASGGYLIVDELPEVGSSQYIYLVPRAGGGYERYVYSNGAWVDIGDDTIDLTDYYTKTQIDTLLGNYIPVINGNARVPNNLTIGGITTAVEHYTTAETIDLGSYVAAAVLSNNSATTLFSIPLGRVMHPGLYLKRLTCNIQGRATNADGIGYYYITDSNTGGVGNAAFDSNAAFTFNCATGASRTLPTSGITVTLHGNTNIYVRLNGASNFFFSGTQAVDSVIDNNGASVNLTNIKVYFESSH